MATKNRSIVLNPARTAAQDTLLDRQLIALNDKAYAAFVALLDAPPKPNERLRKTYNPRAMGEVSAIKQLPEA